MDFLYTGEKPQTSRTKNIKEAKDFIANLKKSSKCANCPETHEACLDFHHIGFKKYSIAYMVGGGYKIKDIEKEISKCIVLCANCHRKSHFSEKS